MGGAVPGWKPARGAEAEPARRARAAKLEDRPMKYLAIAVLLAIVAGAIIHYVNHQGNPPPAESSMGWMQR